MDELRDHEGDRVEQQRVPVGRRLRHLPGGERSARPAPVLDDDALPEGCRHPRLDEARHGVGISARGEGDDHADRAVREALLGKRCRRGEGGTERGKAAARQGGVHGLSSSARSLTVAASATNAEWRPDGRLGSRPVDPAPFRRGSACPLHDASATRPSRTVAAAGRKRATAGPGAAS
jgi:hypothetical protein